MCIRDRGDLAVEQVGEGFGQQLLAFGVGPLRASHRSASLRVRKRFTARYTRSATASRDLPICAAISAVERLSLIHI